MECCASLAAVLKLSPSLRSSRVAVASISIRSVSSFCRSLSVKSLWLEVMLVQRSLQPPPLPAVRIPRGSASLLKSWSRQRQGPRGDDVGAALHGAVLDALHQVVPDQLARLCFVLKSGPQCCRFDVGVGWHVCKVGNRFAALEPIAQGLGRLYGSVEADVARGLALRMDHGSQYLSDHFLNQLRYWGIHPSFGFVEEPETNGVVERWNRTLKEQAVYGRVFRNLAEVRAAVAGFVERYNQCWRLEKLAFRTPGAEAREQYALAMVAQTCVAKRAVRHEIDPGRRRESVDRAASCLAEAKRPSPTGFRECGRPIAAETILEVAADARRRPKGKNPVRVRQPGREAILDNRLPRLLQNLKIAAVPHGFRSSFRDWAAEETNHPREVVEAALAHVVGNRTEAAYARSDLFERRRRLMDEWAAYLDG